MTQPRKYRKKPVVIETMQWDGTPECLDALVEWTGGLFRPIDPEDRVEDPDCTAELFVAANNRWLPIPTGEWVNHDSAGFYPCKKQIFEMTFEAVEQ